MLPIMAKHADICNHIVSLDDFKILMSSNSEFHLKIKESLSISRDKQTRLLPTLPLLNIQNLQSMMKVFCQCSLKQFYFWFYFSIFLYLFILAIYCKDIKYSNVTYLVWMNASQGNLWQCRFAKVTSKLKFLYNQRTA